MTNFPDEAIEERLTVGLGNKGGARGSLTKCVGRLAAQDINPADLHREVSLVQLELHKLVQMRQRNEQETAQIESLEPQIQQEYEKVQQLRQQLTQASTAQSCLQEYETLAKLAFTRHKTSRKVLEAQLVALKEEYQTIIKESREATAQEAVRTAQFQLLMQCMLDLKQSLKEPLEELVPSQSDEMVEETAGTAMDTEEGLYGDL